ncbi:Lysine-specific histone demethylase 1-like [Gracilariopsis chorda]|uniref:Lysine-specific histone demethylase 1-like n=1 Tax=Gracilariopsis chorda TaxID=448386 RepID=A0A2V3J0Z1_9FLOR|nr:Lysine-specific histone demethylase 1-like [Gracilariopsis chorda]|eukprot:PXF48082.1 Lysine-specific histone demethylase 1-like [Gracilariopsis chorda]
METSSQGNEQPASALTPPLCPGAASPVQNIVNKLFENVFKSDRPKEQQPSSSNHPEGERKEKDNNEAGKDELIELFSPGLFDMEDNSDVVYIMSGPEESSIDESCWEIDSELAAEAQRNANNAEADHMCPKESKRHRNNQTVENYTEPKSAQRPHSEIHSHQEPNQSSPIGSSAKDASTKGDSSAPEKLTSQIRSHAMSPPKHEASKLHSRNRSAPSSPFEPEYEEPELVTKASASGCRLSLGSRLAVTKSGSIEEKKSSPRLEAASEIQKREKPSRPNAKALDSPKLHMSNRRADQKQDSRLLSSKKNEEANHVLKDKHNSLDGKQMQSSTTTPDEAHQEQMNGLYLSETKKNRDCHDGAETSKHTAVLKSSPAIGANGKLSAHRRSRPKQTEMGDLTAVTAPEAVTDRKRLGGSDTKDSGLASKHPRSGSLDTRNGDRGHPNKVMADDAHIIDTDVDAAKNVSRVHATDENRTDKDEELKSSHPLTKSSYGTMQPESNGDLDLTSTAREAGGSCGIKNNPRTISVHGETSYAKEGQNPHLNPTENHNHSTVKEDVIEMKNDTEVAGKSSSNPKRKLLEIAEPDVSTQSKSPRGEERPMKRSRSNELRTTPPRKTKKRERTTPSPTTRRVKSGARLEGHGISLKGVSFCGYSDFSTLVGHEISAVIDDQRYSGWVMDPNPPVPSFDFSKDNRNKVLAKRVSDLVKSYDTAQARHTDSPMKPKPDSLTPDNSDVRVLPNAGTTSYADTNMHSHGRTVLDTSVPQRSVLIVGAGIAGIAAARALTERGFKVTVLEGRDRIGGRIATDWSTGFPVDLGAAYIHGAYGNPLSEVAREAELRTFSPRDVDTLFYSNGKRVSRKLDELAENVWKALLRRAGSIAKSGILKQPNLDLSLGKLLNRLKVVVKGGCGKELNELLGWHASNLEMACASELTGLSAKHYDMDDRAGFSGSHKLVRDGYSAIVYALAQTIDIQLGARVVSIQRDVPVEKSSKPVTNDQDGRSTNPDDSNVASAGDGGTVKKDCSTKTRAVRVITDDGSEHVAESCIVTVPLGILQNGDISFVPKLPQRKRTAINSIGFGVVDKIVMEFERPFWISKRYETHDSDKGELDGPDQIGRVSKDQGVFSFFISLWRCVGAPILIAVTSGKFAEFIEQSKDSEVLDMALAALDEMFPDRHSSKLVSHTVTRWKADQFSRGSYSYPRVGTTPQDYIEFSKPVGNLYFAGEATHQDHPATAHGAYMSGLREASRVISGSGLSESARRKYARDLFLMQNPHAFLRNNGAGNRKLHNGHGKRAAGNGDTRGSQKSPGSRTPRKRRKTRRSD